MKQQGCPGGVAEACWLTKYPRGTCMLRFRLERAHYCPINGCSKNTYKHNPAFAQIALLSSPIQKHKRVPGLHPSSSANQSPFPAAPAALHRLPEGLPHIPLLSSTATQVPMTTLWPNPGHFSAVVLWVSGTCPSQCPGGGRGLLGWEGTALQK